MAHCSACGKQISEGVSFCPYCGQRQNRHNRSASSQYNQNSTLNSQVQLGFIGSNLYAIKHSRDLITPESRRSVFWWTLLGVLLLFLIWMANKLLFAFFYVLIFGTDTNRFILTLIISWGDRVIGIIAVFALLTTMIRRLRFLGKTPWLVITLFIPIVQIYAVYLLVVKPKSPYRNMR